MEIFLGIRIPFLGTTLGSACVFFMKRVLGDLVQRALVLSLGIAIQNFPDGALISMPLRVEGESKGKAFLGVILSGVVEPIGTIFFAVGFSVMITLGVALG